MSVFRIEFAHAPKEFTEKPDDAPWLLWGWWGEPTAFPLPKGFEGQRMWFRTRTEDFTKSSDWVYSKSIVIPDAPERSPEDHLMLGSETSHPTRARSRTQRPAR